MTSSGDPRDDGTRDSSAQPPGARHAASLRTRFFLLLATLAVLALVPAIVSEQSHRSLDGFATALEETGSLRYRLLQINTELHHTTSEPETRRHLETLLSDQQQLLSLAVSGDAKSDFAACPTRDVCARFRAHLERWDRDLAPRIRAAMDNRTVTDEVEPALLLEVNELDLTVRAFARAVQSRSERSVRFGVLMSLGSTFAVALAAFGIWRVFRRVERLRDSAKRADTDTLLAEVHPDDEIGALASALASGIAAERERRRAEHHRSEILRKQQQAMRDCTEALSAWIAGENSLEDSLGGLARAVGHTRASLSRPSLRPPPAAPEDADGRTLPLALGQKSLGALTLSGPPTREDVADEELLDTLSQVVAIACLAERLLREKTEQGRLALALASVSARPAHSELGAILQRLLAHDAALLELYDEAGRVEDVWAIHPDRVERLATLCDPHAPDHASVVEDSATAGCPVLHERCAGPQLEIPLKLESRTIGNLILARARSRFVGEDVATAEALAPVVASALGRVQLEGRLRFAEQWSTLGAFGRMLAHEIKNPLNSLGLELQLLERRIGKVSLDEAQREKLRASIGVVKNELARLTALTSDYLSVSPKSGEMTVSLVDLREVVQEVTRAHGAALKDSEIELSENLGNEPAIVEANAGRIKQLLHNLVGNAVEAMATEPLRKLSVTIRHLDGDVELSVRDTGPGVADPIAIFAPGFSTKPSGTGMGLAISQQIARQHGGRLTARAIASGGAEFRLVLSAATSAARASS